MDLIQEHHRSPILKASRHPRPFSVSRKDLKAQLESIDEKLSMSTSEVDALEMQQIEKQRLQYAPSLLKRFALSPLFSRQVCWARSGSFSISYMLQELPNFGNSYDIQILPGTYLSTESR